MYIHTTKQPKRVGNSVYQHTLASVTSTKTVSPLYLKISFQCEIWGEKEDVHHLKYDAVPSSARVTAFLMILLPPRQQCACTQNTLQIRNTFTRLYGVTSKRDSTSYITLLSQHSVSFKQNTV